MAEPLTYIPIGLPHETCFTWVGGELVEFQVLPGDTVVIIGDKIRAAIDDKFGAGQGARFVPKDPPPMTREF